MAIFDGDQHYVEFQAIVLAGGQGSRMYPMTESCSKALLPVGNRPLIYYPLQQLLQAGLTDIIVLVQRADQQLLQYLHEQYEGRDRLIVETTEPELGTAESLRLVKEKIKTDFIVVSCDLVSTLDIGELLDDHRLNNASMTCVVAPLLEFGQEKKGSNRALTEYIGTDEQSNRLLFYAGEGDMDEEFKLARSITVRHPRLTLRTDLLDAHFYVFQKWVIDYIAASPFTSVRSDLVPTLVRKQYRLGQANPDKPYDLYNFVQKDTNISLSMSAAPYDPSDVLRCFAYPTSEFCARVNTVPYYLEVNHRVVQSSLVEQRILIAPTDIERQSTIGRDSMVGAGCKIGVRCSVKKSSIGNHCTIGNSVKLVNSVLMDYVTVQDNVVLQNTVVCKSAHIQSNVDLRDCQVGAMYTVKTGTTTKNESLVASQEYL